MKKRLATGGLCALLVLSMSMSAFASPVSMETEAGLAIQAEEDTALTDQADDTADETAAAEEGAESESAAESETAAESEAAAETESRPEESVTETETQAPDQAADETVDETAELQPEDVPESDEETEPPVDEEANALTAAFVTRLYETLLGRKPDVAGLENWTMQLMNGTKSGSQIIQGFINSTEFTKRNYSNEQFLNLLYKAMFDRGADASGKAHWLDILSQRFTRNYVAAGFVGSKEFQNLCARYNINPGKIVLTDVLDLNPKVSKFVQYLYKLILNRTCDTAGLRNWVTKLVNHSKSAAEVVEGFVFSSEFTKRNYSASDYVKVLYKAILSREADSSGLKNWTDYMSWGLSRRFVLKGLIQSSEFSKLCSSYGIEPGTIKLTEDRDQNQKHTKYVMLAYRNMLGRDASAAELNEWTGYVRSTDNGAPLMLQSIMFSEEADVFKYDYSAFAEYLYKAVLGRSPSASESNSIVNALIGPATRKELFLDLISVSEYETFIGGYELKLNIYQNPAGYYQIRNEDVTLSGGGYDLSYGYEGLKVAKVIAYLGVHGGRYVGMSNKAEYTNDVVNAVMSFQSRKGLGVTGKVNLATWKAMGFSEYDWYNLGAYATPCKTNILSTREDHIEAMISTAYQYLGDDYVVGASGKVGYGLDCSGLVMQALYAAGLSLDGINPVTHSQPGHEYESRNMWRSDYFHHVSYSERQRGDLVFYTNASGSTIIHVAIYLGNDQVIESWPNSVQIMNIKSSSHPYVAGIVRPFM